MSCSHAGHCLQMRAAALEEIKLVLQVLKDEGGFTTGIALAISSHISMELGSLSEPLPIQSAILDHIRLLDSGPLEQLLTFLWVQLGMRSPLLQKYFNAVADIAMVRLQAPPHRCSRRHCMPLLIFAGAGNAYANSPNALPAFVPRTLTIAALG